MRMEAEEQHEGQKLDLHESATEIQQGLWMCSGQNCCNWITCWPDSVKSTGLMLSAKIQTLSALATRPRHVFDDIRWTWLFLRTVRSLLQVLLEWLSCLENGNSQTHNIFCFEVRHPRCVTQIAKINNRRFKVKKNYIISYIYIYIYISDDGNS
jgi:hypothetical protein